MLFLTSDGLERHAVALFRAAQMAWDARETRLVVRGPRVERIAIRDVQVARVPATVAIDVELVAAATWRTATPRRC